MTVAMLQAGMLFQFGFKCCLVRYLLAALLERDGFVLVLRSRESFASVCSCLTRAAFVGSVCTRVTGQVVFARAVPFSGLNTS